MRTTLVNLGVFSLILIIHSTFVEADGAKGDAERGKLLYEKQCSECHGKTGDGTGAVGEVINERPASFLSPESKSKTDQELFDNIQYGRTIEMHPWEGVLTAEQIWDVVRYIRVLAPYVRKTE